MQNQQNILELVDLGAYGSFPLRGLNKPSGFEHYMYSANIIELELVAQNTEQLCA